MVDVSSRVGRNVPHSMDDNDTLNEQFYNDKDGGGGYLLIRNSRQGLSNTPFMCMIEK